MLSSNTFDLARRFVELTGRTHLLAMLAAAVLFAAAAVPTTLAQGPTSAGAEGTVRSPDGKGIPGAKVVFKNKDSENEYTVITDANGAYIKTSLPPAEYEITVTAKDFATDTRTKKLFATKSNTVLPDFILSMPTAVLTPQPPTAPTDPNTPTTPPVTPPSNNTAKTTTSAGEDRGEGLDLGTRRGGTFDSDATVSIPLGGTTLIRSFDQLAFFVPGVNPAPQAIGNSVGPGVGGGVGTSGQFSVNGLRSRANNFTVDGSDNNDEDIGVRRQGFFSLVAQPIESIREFSIITLLAPAEFGRNFGAQVNANSKTGGSALRGAVFGFYNSERLNARNTFDNTSGNSTINLKSLRFGTPVDVFSGSSGTTPIQVTNSSGGKDDLSLFQGGAALGGPIVAGKAFIFVSGEGQKLTGSQERHFAVPTVEERSLFGAAYGLQSCPVAGNCAAIFPTAVDGDSVFSLFPFPNDPGGVYGRNTLTRTLSNDARGLVFSGRFDLNTININSNQQNLTVRYNYTDDKRNLTDVGGAVFSAIKPVVRTDNISTFLNGSITNTLTNEFRFSWGRTRLRFEELPDQTGFLRPVPASLITNEGDRRFLLNAPLLFNVTLPTGCTASGCNAAANARYSTTSFTTASNTRLGPVGQVIIAGYSPVGVDVFNFPQSRTNDTYQFADTMRKQFGRHNLAFGADIRRVFLDSDLPRNSRPLVTFGGGVDCRGTPNPCASSLSGGALARPLDLVAAGAPTGFFQSLVLPGKDAKISLSYNQFDFFVQDSWKIRSNLTVSLGVRYEYNTVPVEADNKILSALATPASAYPSPLPASGSYPGLNIFQGFKDFIDGRTSIYDADKNNFAPRLGFVYSPRNDVVIRGGYGLFYDQVIGAVVSQSRNVFPTFTTLNTGGGDLSCNFINGSPVFQLLNPATGVYGITTCNDTSRIVRAGTLNTLNPASPRDLLTSLQTYFPIFNGTFFGATIPKRTLESPMAHQYSIGVEAKVYRDTFVSAAYVGTTGRKLLRFTTPNLGSNYIARLDGFIVDTTGSEPRAVGTTFDPFINENDLRRKNFNIGPVSQFETTGNSRYDSLQIGVRGGLRNDLRYTVNYAYGDVKDDVSDVFDLAGAFALPQNSLDFRGENAPANFDVRHRFTYAFNYMLPRLRDQSDAVRYIFGGWELAGTGRFNTGQPFTVNTVFDINHDGNLTDRLNNTSRIQINSSRSNPISRTCNITPTVNDCRSLLAAFGRDGSVPRNSFRAGSVLDLDMAVSRRFRIREGQDLQFRVDFFNFINHANFGVPVRFLEAPGFGRATDTITPGRRIQFGLKYNF